MTEIIHFLFRDFSVGVGELKFQGPMIVVAVVIFLSFVSLGWVCADADKRNKNWGLAFLFVCLAGWPLSLLWWLWLRPPLIKKQKSSKPIQPASPRSEPKP